MAVTDHAEAWPRGATPRPRSGTVAERRYPTSEVRGGSQECLAATAQERPRGTTTHPRPVAERSNPMPEEWWLHRGPREEHSRGCSPPSPIYVHTLGQICPGAQVSFSQGAFLLRWEFLSEISKPVTHSILLRPLSSIWHTRGDPPGSEHQTGLGQSSETRGLPLEASMALTIVFPCVFL